MLIYTTRGCFRRPAQDEGRVMASAEITSPVRSLTEPVQFGVRSFTEGCGLRIETLAPFRQGLVLRDLVPQLKVFPDLHSWGVRLRRPILTLPPADGEFIAQRLAAQVLPYPEALAGYHNP
ncbi:hypothetical protein [Streptomyces albidoflavus]|uniref:hypothetical protein n=1 Tax=Streptomyces albidoflavus TaxID=1886 RepID=UPI0011874E43|nr:hypothetical protein [Streptomyces albidoflavus]